MLNDLTILGLGYIGLPMAALAAKSGLRVLGVDVNPDVVITINKGQIHIKEPGLLELVQETVSSGLLKASEKPAASNVFMIAVPTPVDHTTHQPDMIMVEKAARMIAAVAKPGSLVILQSTSPVGATAHIKTIIEHARPELADALDYVYCPERAIPGKTLHEMTHNDRAIGGLTQTSGKRGIKFYRQFIKGKLLECSAETAEMVKLVENASRDCQLAFANELSLVCDSLGLNVWEVIKLANHHPRVNILQPGPGVGGHCIAVDPWFIIDAAPEQTPLMQAARKVNDYKPDWVLEKIIAACTHFKQPKVCLLGLAYKENVDDFRESPALAIAQKLIASEAAEVLVVEPHMKNNQTFNLVSIPDGIAQADIVVLLVAHDEFAAITPEMLDGKTIIDTRGKLPKQNIRHDTPRPVCA